MRMTTLSILRIEDEIDISNENEVNETYETLLAEYPDWVMCAVTVIA